MIGVQIFSVMLVAGVCIFVFGLVLLVCSFFGSGISVAGLRPKADVALGIMVLGVLAVCLGIGFFIDSRSSSSAVSASSTSSAFEQDEPVASPDLVPPVSADVSLRREVVDGVSGVAGSVRHHPKDGELSSVYVDMVVECLDFDASSADLTEAISESGAQTIFDETATLPESSEAYRVSDDPMSYRERFVTLCVPSSALDDFIRMSTEIAPGDFYRQYLDGAIANNMNNVRRGDAKALYDATKSALGSCDSDSELLLLENQLAFLDSLIKSFSAPDVDVDPSVGGATVNLSLRESADVNVARSLDSGDGHKAAQTSASRPSGSSDGGHAFADSWLPYVIVVLMNLVVVALTYRIRCGRWPWVRLGG